MFFCLDGSTVAELVRSTVHVGNRLPRIGSPDPTVYLVIMVWRALKFSPRFAGPVLYRLFPDQGRSPAIVGRYFASPAIWACEHLLGSLPNSCRFHRVPSSVTLPRWSNLPPRQTAFFFLLSSSWPTLPSSLAPARTRLYAPTRP